MAVTVSCMKKTVIEVKLEDDVAQWIVPESLLSHVDADEDADEFEFIELSATSRGFMRICGLDSTAARPFTDGSAAVLYFIKKQRTQECNAKVRQQLRMTDPNGRECRKLCPNKRGLNGDDYPSYVEIKMPSLVNDAGTTIAEECRCKVMWSFDGKCNVRVECTPEIIRYIVKAVRNPECMKAFQRKTPEPSLDIDGFSSAVAVYRPNQRKVISRYRAASGTTKILQKTVSSDDQHELIAAAEYLCERRKICHHPLPRCAAERVAVAGEHGSADTCAASTGDFECSAVAGDGPEPTTPSAKAARFESATPSPTRLESIDTPRMDAPAAV